MTDKKKRQRGSRTHGGGSHKNRRGAGHRGGRGKAGRDKHEFHNHEPLGKTGFTPQDPLETEEVSIQDIDETLQEIELGFKQIEDVDGIRKVPNEQSDSLVADGGIQAQGNQASLPEETDQNNMRYHVILSEYADEYEKADQAKLIGKNQIHYPFTAEVDDCSRNTKRVLTNAGGQVYYDPNGRGFAKSTPTEKVISRRFFNNSNNNNDNVETLNEYLERVEDGETLRFHEFEEIIEAGPSDPQLAYEVMQKHARNLEGVDGLEAVKLLISQAFSREYEVEDEQNPISHSINSYFSGMDPSEEQLEVMRVGMPDYLTVDDVLSGLDKIHDSYAEDIYEGMDDLRKKRIRDEERNYLLTVEGLVDWLDL